MGFSATLDPVLAADRAMGTDAKERQAVSLPWFRMYAEFAKDPKVQSMDETLQRRLVMLFCLKCSDELNLSHDELACALRISSEELETTLEVFRRKGFIDQNDALCNWEKRQFTSDSSSERVRRYRERKRNGEVTLQERDSNGDVTPPDTDTDTDTELEKRAKPRPSKRCPSNFEITADLRAWAAEKFPAVDIEAQTEAFRDWEYAKPRTDWPAAWRSWIRKAADFGGKGAAPQKRGFVC